jgi:ethanolamine transporter EutH
VFTNSTGAAPTIFAPTTLAGTGGYILATNAAKNGLEWVAANGHIHS